MIISTIKYAFSYFNSHGTINNVLIDKGCPLHMLSRHIVPHPSVHGAPRSGHHGHLLPTRAP